MKKLVLLALAWAAPALADACDKANTQTDMTVCYGGLASKSDAVLNRVYGALLARWKGDSGAVQALRVSERAWAAYRKAECDREGYPTAGGSAQPMVIALCLKSITDERITLLKADLTCKEGDLTCLKPQP